MRKLGLATALAAAALLSACNPFSGLETDKTGAIEDGQGSTVELLTPKRRLPTSASGIRYRFRHFQDSALQVRFEAPLKDAKAFASEMLATRNDACSWHKADLEGWPAALPVGARCGQDHVDDGDGMPPIMVAIIPRGERAVILVDAFSY